MKTRFIFAALFASFLLLLAGLAPASAHTITPTSAAPQDGAVLAQSPSQVYLVFPEEVAEDGSTLQVFDAQGLRQVDLGQGGVDLNDPKHAGLVVKLPDLAQGVYLVKWKVLIVSDGDTSQGQYYFGVGNVTLPQNPPAPAASNTPQPGGVTPAAWAFLATGIIILAAATYFYRGRRKPVSKP
jgi:methionine-rich copper-binding protein CopC